MATLLRTLLHRLSGRGLASAWLVVCAVALSGSLGYSFDHEGYASATKELQQPLEKHVASAQARRLSVAAPASKVSKHGPAGSGTGVLSSNHAGLTQIGAEVLSAIAVAVFVPTRRVANASPRAPPR